MRKLRLNLQQTQSDVWIGYDLPEQLNRLRLQGKSRRAFLVVDRVLKQTASSWVSELQEAGWRVDVHFVRASESLKSYSSLEPIYSWLIEKGADRNSVIFAIGGGTVGDAVGFVAGTYLRGIRWVSVPTTLLAQVDSGLGGKTAMNHRLGKNLIGVFHQPVAVLCDVGFLKTLPKREFTSGLGEIVKYGIALDRALFKYIESRTREGVQELFADSQGRAHADGTCPGLRGPSREQGISAGL
jgi:3-dehydroquinate synthase